MKTYKNMLIGFVTITMILLATACSDDEMVPTAIVCPSFGLSGASWDITQTDGGYYVDGTFYSSKKNILDSYRIRGGKDCKLVY
jgi:hypothetical protein